MFFTNWSWPLVERVSSGRQDSLTSRQRLVNETMSPGSHARAHMPGTESNGFEACRQLLSSLEPVSRTRPRILNAILGWSSFDTQKNILSQLVKIEHAFREYEKTGATLAEEIKFAALMTCVSGNIKTWLQLQVSESTSYVTLREKVLEYDKATLKWYQL